MASTAAENRNRKRCNRKHLSTVKSNNADLVAGVVDGLEGLLPSNVFSVQKGKHDVPFSVTRFGKILKAFGNFWRVF